MKKILVIGKDSQLGCELSDYVSKHRLDGLDFIFAGRKDYNLFSKSDLLHYILDLKPDVVINFVAYTDVDSAEDPENLGICIHLNSNLVSYLTDICKMAKAIFVHISTDYVFDGDKGESDFPYLENDKVHPINRYGFEKAHGEKYMTNDGLKKYYLIRTSWLFGPYGNKNFLLKMIKFFKEKESISIVNDQFGCPTYSLDLIEFIIHLIESDSEFGVYHFCNSGVVSWYDFAKKIFEIGQDLGYKFTLKELNATDSNAYKTKAKRPKRTAMCCQKASDTGYSIYNHDIGIKDTLIRIK